MTDPRNKQPVDGGDQLPPLVFDDTLGRLIRSGGWDELAQGTPRLVARALEEGDLQTAAALADFLREEMRVVFDIYAQWIPDTLKYLGAMGMAENEQQTEVDGIRDRLSRWHRSLQRPREQVWAEIEAMLAALTSPQTADRRATLDAAVEAWRDLHDGEVDLISALFNLVVRLHGEPALHEMYESWVIGDWFAKRYQRFDVSKIAWDKAAWLLTYLALEGHHGHLSGTDRDGSAEVHEDDEKIVLSWAPCGSGGRTLQGERRDGMPPLRDSEPGWTELREPHDFTWNESGISPYCAHCCMLHETLPIAAFGYPVRVTDPPHAPLSGESRCRWTIYKNLRAIPEAAYARVGAVKPPPDAPLGSAEKQRRDAMMGKCIDE